MCTKDTQVHCKKGSTMTVKTTTMLLMNDDWNVNTLLKSHRSLHGCKQYGRGSTVFHFWLRKGTPFFRYHCSRYIVKLYSFDTLYIGLGTWMMSSLHGHSSVSSLESSGWGLQRVHIHYLRPWCTPLGRMSHLGTTSIVAFLLPDSRSYCR